MRDAITIACACFTMLVVGCMSGTPSAHHHVPPIDDLLGVYTSPREIGRYSGTVLVLRRGFRGEFDYDKRFYSDVQGDGFERPETSGSFIIEGDRLYLPYAFGFYDSDRKPVLISKLDRYAFRRINGKLVVMRDDALKAFESRNKLYDYGILIRVADAPADWYSFDLSKAEHLSIKTLYSDSAKKWDDPFVHGPNER
jgi:hypothetical protein